MFGHKSATGRYPYVQPYLHVRPSSASRSPSAYSALCRGQIGLLPASAHRHTVPTAKHAPPAAQPVQNSPVQPVRLTGAKLSQHPKAHSARLQAGRNLLHTFPDPQQEGFVPAPSARYKTLPARQQPNRYKTLPTRPKAHFSTFYPSRKTFYHHPAPRRPAGELCTARCQTRFSKLYDAPASSPPVQNSPNPRSTAIPKSS